MVFKGQDAWRKHPLLANCHSNPFPHFRLAVGIFAAYVVADSALRYLTANPVPDPPKIKFGIRRGDLDGFPIAKRPGGHH